MADRLPSAEYVAEEIIAHTFGASIPGREAIPALIRARDAAVRRKALEDALDQCDPDGYDCNCHGGVEDLLRALAAEEE